MNTPNRSARRRHTWLPTGLASLFLSLSLGAGFGAGVPVRLSFKFILNSAGNRPAAGDINTDAEIHAQIQRGNQILPNLISELRLQNVEIVDVAGVSQWYNAGTGSRDDLRSAAMADPTTYRWRNDAVNVYITAADDSARADLAPNNNIIVLCQGIFDTTVAHEVGHILGLSHTHETCCGGDGCGDTLMDDPSWDQNAIARNNFGVSYAQLNSSQRSQVDLVWGNLMSYHDADNRSLLSPCQMDKQSAQAYSDRNRLLAKIPVYVDASYGGSVNGSFAQPYQSIQQALNAGALAGKVAVLKQGSFARPAGRLNGAMEFVTRRGDSAIREAPPAYSLPYDLELSRNATVRDAVIRAQQNDRQGDLAGVIANLQEAEKHAVGREKSAIRMELAQRFRDSDRHKESAAYFKAVAEGADDEKLRSHALKRADLMLKRAEGTPAGKGSAPGVENKN